MSGTPCPAPAIAFSFSAENSMNPEWGFEPSSGLPEVCVKLAANCLGLNPTSTIH